MAENNGCELGAECPQGFCVHIAGTAGLDVQFFQRLVKDFNASTGLKYKLNDIPDLEVP